MLSLLESLNRAMRENSFAKALVFIRIKNSFSLEFLLLPTWDSRSSESEEDESLVLVVNDVHIPRRIFGCHSEDVSDVSETNSNGVSAAIVSSSIELTKFSFRSVPFCNRVERLLLAAKMSNCLSCSREYQSGTIRWRCKGKGREIPLVDLELRFVNFHNCRVWNNCSAETCLWKTDFHWHKPPVLMAIVDLRSFVDTCVNALNKARSNLGIFQVEIKTRASWIAREYFIDFLTSQRYVNCSLDHYSSSKAEPEHLDVLRVVES